MLKEINFKTSFYKEDLFTKFKIKEGDTVKFNVLIEDAPDAINELNKARLLLKRYDNSVIYEEIDVVINDKIVTFIAPNGTTEVEGVVYGELEFSDDETYISSTFVFVFDVVSRSANINEAIESKDEIFIIREIRDFIAQVKEDLMRVNEEITNLNGAKEHLENLLEDATDKANELIYEVNRRDLNVEELKKENERAESNLVSIDEKSKEAESNLKDLIVLSEEAIQNIDMIKGNIINLIVDEKGNALEHIQGEVKEGLENINVLNEESIKNINELKDNVINLIVDEKASSLKGIEDFKTGAIEQIEDIGDEYLNNIEDSGDEVLDEINELKANTLNDLNVVINEGLSSINDFIDEGIENINSSLNAGLSDVEAIKNECIKDIEDAKDAFDNISEEGLRELGGLLDEAKNVSSELDEKIQSGTTVISNINTNINTAEKTNMSLIDNITNAENINEVLEQNILVSNSNNNTLLNTIETAENIKNEIEDTLREGSEVLPGLNEKVESLLEIENLINDLVVRAENSINELNVLHPESDVRIETLNRLIQEAKRYEEVVRRWIDNNGDGNIATEEVLVSIETLKDRIEEVYEELNGKLKEYATKEELEEAINGIEIPSVEGFIKADYVDEAISNIEIPTIDHLATKEEVETYRGKIGEDIHPACFKSAPPMLDTETGYIRLKFSDKYDDIYRVYYFEETKEINYYARQTYNPTGEYQVLFNRPWGVACRIFEYKGTTWTQAESNNTFIQIADNISGDWKNNVYSFNMNLCSKDWNSIYLEAKPGDPANAPLNDYNGATETGDYKVHHTEAINNSYIDTIDGILIVRNADKVVYQQLISDDSSINVYRMRKEDGVWTAWSTITPEVDMENIYTKEEVDEIVSNISGGSSSDSIFDNNYISLLNNTIEIMKQRGL